jgi:hypothetical protein
VGGTVRARDSCLRGGDPTPQIIGYYIKRNMEFLRAGSGD